MSKKWANVLMIVSLIFAVCSPTSYAAAKTLKVTVTRRTGREQLRRQRMGDRRKRER